MNNHAEVITFLERHIVFLKGSAKGTFLKANNRCDENEKHRLLKDVNNMHESIGMFQKAIMCLEKEDNEHTR